MKEIKFHNLKLGKIYLGFVLISILPIIVMAMLLVISHSIFSNYKNILTIIILACIFISILFMIASGFFIFRSIETIENILRKEKLGTKEDLLLEKKIVRKGKYGNGIGKLYFLHDHIIYIPTIYASVHKGNPIIILDRNDVDHIILKSNFILQFNLKKNGVSKANQMFYGRDKLDLLRTVRSMKIKYHLIEND